MKTIVGIDTSYLEEIANGDEEFVLEMINLFAEQAPVDIAGLSSGISQKDWNGIYQHAHKLKYAIGSLGRDDLKEKLEEVEDLAKEEEGMEVIGEHFQTVKKEIQAILVQLT
ncbi:MAG: Hpt domain-containing protein [Bacteroidota bacterium]